MGLTLLYGSLFSGVGGFDKGFDEAGFNAAFQVEIDNQCRQVLATHWPDVPRFEDVQDVGKDTLPNVDVLTGCFPCQDLSVAGNNAGLAGSRSGLWWEFHRIISEISPRWVVIENVPGLFSSNEKRDMGILLGSLAQLGYWWAYRVLDSQYFGVAQRRRRVFIVGSLGSPTGAAQVLFESASLPGHPPPRRKTGQEVAAALTGRTRKGGFTDPVQDGSMGLVYDARGHGDGEVSPTMTGDHQNRVTDYMALVFQQNQRTEVREIQADGEVTGAIPAKPGVQGQNYIYQWASGGGDDEKDTAQALRAEAEHSYQIVHQPGTVRRLTPLECERLQGFPDGWTLGASDSARYRMMGNAVTVPVARWIAARIMEFEKGEL